jgi:hypothetical protein
VTRLAQTSEKTVHQWAVDYLKLQYPGILFRTDYAAGMKLSMFQAVAHKKLQAGRAWPDLFIAQPRGEYHGCFIELKKAGTVIFLKNGQMTSDPHIREQAQTLARLRDLGYFAEFAIGFEDIKRTIDFYLRD